MREGGGVKTDTGRRKRMTTRQKKTKRRRTRGWLVIGVKRPISRYCHLNAKDAEQDNGAGCGTR